MFQRLKRFLLAAGGVSLLIPNCVAMHCLAGEQARGDSTNLLAKQNLAAWCIVPFDARSRTPAQRAEMLKRLGFTKLAYDWRDEHVPTFEDEILCLKKQNIEFFAFWSPASKSEGYQAMLRLIEKYRLKPQIWMIAPSAKAENQQRRIEVNAGAMLPFVRDAKRLGCKFGLYNHGGWSGEPDNLIALVKWLREHAETRDIGIVYNFHHGHEHLAQFPDAFRIMVPYLICLNLNGMTVGGPKILPLAQGKEDVKLLKMVQESGYCGPIGILDHRADIDAEASLKQNLHGLHNLLMDMGEKKAAKTYDQ